MFSVDGLISGLDTTSIIEGALSLQQSRLDRLAVRKQDVTQEQTAFKTIEARLLGLRGSLSQVMRSSNNAFDSKTATTSDEEAVAVSASSKAAVGNYRFRVSQLAQAHQIKSNGFSSRSEVIEDGTISIRVGNRAETQILVRQNNNTLQGVADAINTQSEDVTATIIDDGSSSDTPLRLLVSSKHTGAENEIQIAFNVGGRNRGKRTDTQPDFSGPAVQDAQDAQVRLGTGEGAITVSSATNQFDSLFDGITFDAFRADPEKEIRLTVEENTEQVTEALEGFVEAYNGVAEFISANSQFDPETETGGLLLGNRSADAVQSKLRAALSTVVQGVNKEVRTLGAVGISTDDQGKLTLDTSKLQDILTGRVEGVGIDDIRRLFAIDGQSDNAGVEFVLGTKNTKASPIDPETGRPIPYEVEINRAAEAARLEAVAPLLETTVFNTGNDTLDIVIDNAEISVSVPEGSYTREDLADQIQTLINTSPDRAGREIVARIVNERLVLESASVGSASSIRIVSGTANAPLGLTDQQSAAGTDVAGVFRVQVPGQPKKTEQATGNGRLLSSRADNKYTAQLQVRSSLSSNQISAITDAHLTVTRGIGAALDAAIGELLNDTDGQRGELATAQDRFDLQIQSIDDDIEQVEVRLEARRESLVREFAALESTLAELQSIGSSLSSGLSAALTL